MAINFTPPAKRLLFAWCLVALWALALIRPAMAAPVYNIVPLAFDDLEHNRNDGYKFAVVNELNEAGQVSGVAYRFDGGSTDLGQSAWFYDGARTIHIGLTGAEHTRNDGYKLGVSLQLNEAGQVLGFSNRFNGSTDMGITAWRYDGATTIEIGLFNSEHTGIDGYKFNDGSHLNEAGQVSGTSYRYSNSGIYLGTSAWFFDGATSIAIGLTGSEHTRNDGYKSNVGSHLNEAGQVSGFSLRFNGGSTHLGQSAWFYNGASTIHIGLTGSEYTSNEGNKSSTAQQLNEAGQVIGFSARFNILGHSGQTSWLYDGATTIDIGLIGSEHTSVYGYKWSFPVQLNEAGQVSGISLRFNGNINDLGQSAWFYNGATTIDIGLTGAEHTNFHGRKSSSPRQLNEVGQVSGYSRRYNGGNANMGETAWLYNGATTVAVGLTGSEHTRNDGYKFSDTTQLNETGQVGGFSYRYNGGGTQLGQDAWLYDSQLDQSFSLNLSTRSDGYAFSQAHYLGEDGLVLGTYSLFDALDNDLGTRAFSFSIADGLHDLGSLVEGGLPASGWDYLASAFRANGLGQILGHGRLTSQSGGQMAYLLTPVVPEPSSLLLAALGFLCLATHIKRYRAAK